MPLLPLAHSRAAPFLILSTTLKKQKCSITILTVIEQYVIIILISERGGDRMRKEFVIKRRGIGYKRVSTQQQVDKFGFDVQEEMITKYAEENNIEIVVWIEESYTGDSLSRPELNKILLGNYESYKADCIVVAKGDRFARNIECYYALKLNLRNNCGLELISASEDFGQMGTLKTVMESFLASYAEIERITINQRTSGGREKKRITGGYCGGRAPYGYKIENSQLVIIDEQAKVVRTIFELHESGLSMREICDRLNELGIKSTRGGNFNPSTIHTILSNENTYSGLYRYGKDSSWVKGQHEPILSPAYRW